MNATLQIIAGLFALLVGGELLVRGASKLAATLKISPLVIGLTVVAFGTSSPELAVSVQSAFAGNADIAVGNVVGSNIFNILFILGVSALIVPLVVSSQLIRRDVPIMVGASFLLVLLGIDGQLSRMDGLCLFTGIVIYTVWCVRQSRRESAMVLAEFAAESPSPIESRKALLIQIGLIVGGLVLLSFGSHWLVTGSVSIATKLGVSELIIGLTIVAAGTSLPEVVTSIMAAIRGERDIAVGNVVGSNLFNIFCVLGIAGLISPDGVAVSARALQFDIPVMVVVAVACLPIFFTGNVIARWEGGLFLSYFIAYMTFLVLDAMSHPFSHTLGTVMIWFVIPLTLATMAVIFYRETKKPSAI